MEIKKKEEEIRKQEEYKKNIAELNNKYGEKYVNSVVKGEIIVGMPEELFLAAVNTRLIKGVTSTRIDHQSQNRTCYKLFGYKSHDYGSTYEITSDALIGWVWVNDGKISSIDWL